MDEDNIGTVDASPTSIVHGFFEQVYNRRNWDFVKDRFAADYTEHAPNGAKSADECLSIIQGACGIFPDLHVEVEDVIAESDLVAARVHFHGTHRGGFFGVSASGRAVGFEAMEFFRVREGRITESWGSWPIYDILSQIGSGET